MREFHFQKMQGCGNDFLILDCLRENESMSFKPEQVRFLCDRNFGIGADGVIILNRSFSAAAKWIFYNSDGSRANMCGNGARCVVRYIGDKYAPTEDLITVETDSGTLKGKRLDDAGMVEISLNMEVDSHNFRLTDRSIRLKDTAVRVFEIDTGVPHAVIEVKNIMDYPIEEIGRQLVRHPVFGDQGSNVTFFQPQVGSQIYSTTFERGVEKETLACGTGAAAAALVFAEMYSLPLPVQVETPGGILQVDQSPIAKKLLLRGHADYVFSVTIEDIPSEFLVRKPFSQGGMSKDARPV